MQFKKDFTSLSTYQGKLVLQEIMTDADRELNQSKVTYALYMERKAGASSSAPYNNNSNQNDYQITLNGSVVASGHYTYDFRNTGSKQVKTGSIIVPHDSDGTKTISVAFRLVADMTIGSSPAQDYTCNYTGGSFALTSIPQDPTLRVKIGGQWKRAKAFVKIGGHWAKVKRAFIKVGGHWVESERG